MLTDTLTTSIKHKALPTPAQLQNDFPINATQIAFVKKTRQEIRHILDGKDSRLLLIVGPCSIHNVKAAIEYASYLRDLSQKLSHTFLIVMRVYLEKPRTKTGWKGLLYDPSLDETHDIQKGLQLSRQLLLDLIDMQVPTATEFLDPASASYIEDLITWGCIGARTVSSQVHRQMASGLTMPVAFKNNTDGNVDVAIQGICSAKMPHVYIGFNHHGQVSEIHTPGNAYGHVVLRGSKLSSNYDSNSIYRTIDLLDEAKLSPRLIIDCSHDNSRRKHEEQVPIFQSVLKQILEGNTQIAGLILESYLEAGNQPLTTNLSKLNPKLSITDPCLDWTATEKLLLWAASTLNQAKEAHAIVQPSHLPLNEHH